MNADGSVDEADEWAVADFLDAAVGQTQQYALEEVHEVRVRAQGGSDTAVARAPAAEPPSAPGPQSGPVMTAVTVSLTGGQIKIVQGTRWPE